MPGSQVRPRSGRSRDPLRSVAGAGSDVGGRAFLRVLTYRARRAARPFQGVGLPRRCAARGARGGGGSKRARPGCAQLVRASHRETGSDGDFNPFPASRRHAPAGWCVPRVRPPTLRSPVCPAGCLSPHVRGAPSGKPLSLFLRLVHRALRAPRRSLDGHQTRRDAIPAPRPCPELPIGQGSTTAERRRAEWQAARNAALGNCAQKERTGPRRKARACSFAAGCRKKTDPPFDPLRPAGA